MNMGENRQPPHRKVSHPGVLILVCLPAADEELVLQQDGEEEEDHALGGHGEQVLPHEVPLQGVQFLLGPWGKEGHTARLGWFCVAFSGQVFTKCLTPNRPKF